MKYPEIKTADLLLSAFRNDDILDLVKYAGHELVEKTTVNMPHPYTEEIGLEWMKRMQKYFENGEKCILAIRNPKTETLMGAVGLHIDKQFNHAEIGYWIGVPFWGAGIATKAVKEMIKFGFDAFGFRKIYGSHMIENPASGRVMEKAGMYKEAELRQHIKKGDVYFDLIQYAILNKNMG